MSLDIRTEPGGERLYVEAQPMHAGDPLELRFPDGTWVAGRYEYRIAGGRLSFLWFYAEFHEREVCFEIAERDELRLPRGGR